MSKFKDLKRYRQTEPEGWEQRVSGVVPQNRTPGTATITPVKQKKKVATPYQYWLVPGIVILVLLSMIGFVAKVFLSSSDGPKKPLYQVTMIKHLPPEEKVKPPEPEQLKEPPKESIQNQVEIPQPEAQSQPDNAPPAGADLGVAGEGGAGSDGFGLVGKGKNYKGRDITLGSGGGSGMSRLALLTKYSGYTRMLQEEIKRIAKKTMEENGGIPKGKFQTMVKLTLDANGAVTSFRLVGTSGNEKMDAAVNSAVALLKMKEIPPEGMPRSMTLKITSQG